MFRGGCRHAAPRRTGSGAAHLAQQDHLGRRLDPGPEGLPLEIYAFANDTSWFAYEGIQSDIFDHILAIVPEFGLRLFQKPTGADLTSLTASPVGSG